jgi:phosphatidylserine/phosphatidylglycerophosphate/cardiolipin synthase-like enzyme
MEMAEAAGRTLDVQYFLIQSDDTGQLLIEALLSAADRGVRVRVLLDDAGSFGRDAQVRTLAGYPNVELRLFNPFAYRGDLEFVHVAEYLGDGGRLNYRMHNKLFVVDNEIGIVGGRNVGDEYFQGGRDFEFGRLRRHRGRSDRQPGLEAASMPSGTARWRFRSEALAASQAFSPGPGRLSRAFSPHIMRA